MGLTALGPSGTLESMSARLIPCAGCQRHVRANEEACPFCGAAVATVPAHRLPSTRLGRAATFAFGAALAAATSTGCTESHEPVNDGGGLEPDAGDDASITDDGSLPFEDSGVAPPYGAPPDDGGIAPVYGGPPDD